VFEIEREVKKRETIVNNNRKIHI
ncbi:unnamed protein product, partial [Allacma fusca]